VTIMLSWNFNHLSFVLRTTQLREYFFMVGVTMASTQCHAQSRLRFCQVVLPSPASLPLLICSTAGLGILLQALSSPVVKSNKLACAPSHLLSVCDPCQRAKVHQLPFNNSTHFTTSPSNSCILMFGACSFIYRRL
jgi:hypothetical protein